MAASGPGVVAACPEVRPDLLERGAALAAGSCRTVSLADGKARSGRHPRSADAAQFHGAFASLDLGNRPERTMARSTEASRNAAAGRATRILSWRDGAACRTDRYLGDRILAGSGGRQPGQGMDQGHLANALFGRASGSG